MPVLQGLPYKLMKPDDVIGARSAQHLLSHFRFFNVGLDKRSDCRPGLLLCLAGTHGQGY